MKKDLRVFLLEECFAMVKHLSAEGKVIPKLATTILNLEEENCCESDISDAEVLKLHNELSKKIAPARPRSIWLLYKESKQNKIWRFLGPVVLIRRLMLAALISLLVFILISCSPDINYMTIKEGIYVLSGWNLLLVLIFYLSSASLGASFSNLFLANRYIVRNVFDPKYESSYWIRFVLGVIAGIMLAVIIPVPDVKEGGQTYLAVASRPVLAMLGGFSASLVYRILFRLVFAVESIFVGKESDVTEQKINNLQAAHELQRENDKQKMVSELYALQGDLSQINSVDEMKKKVQETIETIKN